MLDVNLFYGFESHAFKGKIKWGIVYLESVPISEVYICICDVIGVALYSH